MGVRSQWGLPTIDPQLWVSWISHPGLSFPTGEPLGSVETIQHDATLELVQGQHGQPIVAPLTLLMSSVWVSVGQRCALASLPYSRFFSSGVLSVNSR